MRFFKVKIKIKKWHHYDININPFEKKNPA